MATKKLQARTGSKSPKVTASATAKASMPDWTTSDHRKPMFDKNRNEYLFAVRTRYTSTGGEELEARLEEAAQTAIESLMSYYNKQVNAASDIVGQLLGHAEIRDWHLDPRPGRGGKLKVLVAISAEVFDTIPKNLDDIVALTDKAIRTVMINTARVKRQIDIAKRAMKKAHRAIKKWPGNVRNLDLEREAEKLDKFLPALKKFLKENNKPFREDHEDHIELGFGADFKLEYVISYRSPGVPLSIGLDVFKETFPISNPRTMANVFYLYEIEDSFNKNMPWTDFVTNFVYPVPDIRPGEIKADISNPLQAVDNLADSLSLSPIKDLDKINLENLKINSVDFKQQMLEIRSQVSDFIGDTLLQNLRDIIEDIETLDDVFENVLNKIDLSTISQQVMDAIARQLSTLDYISSMVMGVLSNLSLGDLKNIILPALPFDVVEQINLEINEFPIDIEGFDGSIIDLVSRFNNIETLTKENILLLIRNAMPKEKIVTFGIDIIKTPEFDAKCLPLGAVTEFLQLATEEGLEVNVDILDPELPLDELQEQVNSILSKLGREEIGNLISRLKMDFLMGIISCVKLPKLRILFNFELPNLIFDFKLKFNIPNFDINFEIQKILDAIERFADLLELLEKLPELLPDIKIPNIDLPSVPDIPNLNIPDFDVDFSVPEFPQLPSFEFPELPTFDLNVDLAEQIKIGIKDLLEGILIDVTKNVLIDLLDNFEGATSDSIGDPSFLDFGSEPINKLLSDTAKGGTTEPAFKTDTTRVGSNSPATLYAPESIADVLDEMELDTEYVSDDGDVVRSPVFKDGQDSYTKRSSRRYRKRKSVSRREDYFRFVNSVSRMLTPIEVSDLLRGVPKKEIIEAILDCAQESRVDDGIKNESDVIDFFEKIGKKVDPVILIEIRKPNCEKLETVSENPREANLPNISFCNPGQLEYIKNLLEQKSGGITKEQIEEAAQKIIDRKKSKIKNLASLATKKNLLADMENVSIFDGPTRLVKDDPVSLQYMTKKTIDTIFNGAEMSISTDLSSISANFVKVRDVPLVEGVDYFLNDRMREEDPNRYNEIKNEKENSFKPVASVAPELRDVLSSPRVVSSRRVVSDNGQEEIYASEHEIRLPVLDVLNSAGAKEIREEISSLRKDIERESERFLNTPIRNIPERTRESFESKKRELRRKELDLEEFRLSDKFGGPSIKVSFPKGATGSNWSFIKDSFKINIDNIGEYTTRDGFRDNPLLRGIVSRYNLRGEAPAPQEVFARIMTDAIMANRQDYSPSDVCDPEDPVYYHFLGDYYQVVFGDTIKRFVREIANSDFFNVGLFEDLLTSLSMAGMDNADSLRGILNENVPENRPFIDIKGTKERVEESYKKQRDADGLNSDAFVNANIEGVFEALVKVFCSDVLMKGIFAFSVYEGADFRTQPIFEEVLYDLVYKEIVKEAGLERIFSKELPKINLRRAISGSSLLEDKPRVQREIASLAREQYEEVFGTLEDCIRSVETQGNSSKLISLNSRLLGLDEDKRSHFIKTVDLWRQQDGKHFYGAPSGFYMDPDGVERTAPYDIGKYSRELMDSIGGVGLRGFVYERYVAIEGYSREELEAQGYFYPRLINRLVQDFGDNPIYNLSEFEDYLIDLRDDISNTWWEGKPLSTFFKKINFGIRLSYIDAHNNDDSRVLFDSIRSTQEKLNRKNPFAVNEQAVFPKYTRLVVIPLIKEQMPARYDLTGLLSIFPGQSEERDLSLNDIKFGDVLSLINRARSQGTRFLNLYRENEQILKNRILESNKFKALFYYSLPVDKITSITVLHSIISLTRMGEDKTFFANARQSLQMLLRTLMNSSNFQYTDQLVTESGGIADMLKKELNMSGINGSLPNLAALAAKTPMYILKGLVEMTDPNISISSKMVMAAELLGKEYPGGSRGAALSLLPVNVFPPPPFGPGIGPPITPPGFVYLALDGIRTPYEKAKKNMSRKERKAVEELEKLAEEKAREEAERLAKEAEDELVERAENIFDRFVNASDGSSGTSEVLPEDPCD